MVPHLQHIAFRIWEWVDEHAPFPGKDWFSHFPPSVLHIHLLTVFQDLPAVYLNFVDDVETNRAMIYFKFLHLDDPRFSWEELYRSHPSIAGGWMQFSLRMKDIGITVLDSKGLTWMMLPAAE
ncbi:hypothetical protein CALCODRAFT_372206 [Calocera cornea HHB12733]|uniref:Uncharacterized protein n=1 Tax=Calocera cornea HHB12733 TaxID=1353952 RepID=A0A165EGJ6_9BASI|nr:hypothetical protein CALCODRAFT_372206 [Calocera cornea HHB12733]